MYFAGCRIGGRVYKEGEMIRDIKWKAAACDNCFCAMGAIRCVPLACAPPLQGCTPIVREGQCCPSTYNCSQFTFCNLSYTRSYLIRATRKSAKLHGHNLYYSFCSSFFLSLLLFQSNEFCLNLIQTYCRQVAVSK